MKTCDSCGVEWIYKTGIDMKDHWYEFNGVMFCQQCYADGNADEDGFVFTFSRNF